MQLAEGFGNYVYVLFVIGYIIYNVIKASKKVTANRPGQNRPDPSAPAPAVPPSEPIPAPSKEDEVKKMLEELFGGVPEVRKPKQPAQPVPVPVAKPKTPRPSRKAAPASARVPLTKPLMTKSTETAIESKFIAHPEVLEPLSITPVAEEEPVRPDFDLKQAILYSEILKRPAY